MGSHNETSRYTEGFNRSLPADHESLYIRSPQNFKMEISKPGDPRVRNGENLHQTPTYMAMGMQCRLNLDGKESS